MVTTQEEPATQVSVGPAPREGILSFFRRWRRSLGRHRGLRYWLSVYGLIIFPLFVFLFVINGPFIGWQVAYDVSVQIDSPWNTSVPWLAVFLSLAGWLAIPALVGAVIGQIVVETTGNRRTRSPSVASRRKSVASRRKDGKGGNYIPLLNRLLYAGHGYTVRRSFADEFVRIHHGNWNMAQSHWEILVGEFLNSAATDDKSYVTPRQTMIQAVNAAAALLPEPVNRCPHCQPLKDPKEGSATP